MNVTPQMTELYGRSAPLYAALVGRFPLRPIRSEADLDAATAVVHELIDLEKMTAAQEDYLGVLSTLVEQYEDDHYPIEEPK